MYICYNTNVKSITSVTKKIVNCYTCYFSVTLKIFGKAHQYYIVTLVTDVTKIKDLDELERENGKIADINPLNRKKSFRAGAHARTYLYMHQILKNFKCLQTKKDWSVDFEKK